MTPPGQGWNEENLSENPAVVHLRRLGYTYIASQVLDTERDSFKEVVLTKRLAAALKRLNPWLAEDNLHKAVRAVTNVSAASLIEASERLHTLLTYGISLEQDLGGGKKGQTVRFFDFDDPKKNELLVTRQYKVQGGKKNIRPDIVLLVNGIPLAIVECKSPTLGEGWKAEAIDQFSRYQELETHYRELGAPKLFEPVQLLVATCGPASCYGTVTTPHRFYSEWKTMWPSSEAAFTKANGHAPSAQETLIEGMLAPANLLDLMRNFVVFERDPNTGRPVRKLCRYQQFAAVNKAIERARTSKMATDRGGVVWHTQGSGKSLTMLWLALKLRRVAVAAMAGRGAAIVDGDHAPDQAGAAEWSGAGHTPPVIVALGRRSIDDVSEISWSPSRTSSTRSRSISRMRARFVAAWLSSRWLRSSQDRHVTARPPVAAAQR